MNRSIKVVFTRNIEREINNTTIINNNAHSCTSKTQRMEESATGWTENV